MSGRGSIALACLRNSLDCLPPARPQAKRYHDLLLEIPGSAIPRNYGSTLQAEMQHDLTAKTCLDLYASLPSTGKPKTRSNGVKEWTVLAGLVLSRPGDSEERASPGSSVQESTVFECVSLAYVHRSLRHACTDSVLLELERDVCRRRNYLCKAMCVESKQYFASLMRL